MHIITSGKNHLDIDAYAGIIAYAELLNRQHISAQAISTAKPNESVSPIVRSWGNPIETTYTPQLHDQFTLVDVSEPQFFDGIVKHSQINEVIDHHMDFKAMWDAKLGDKSQIAFVGAACTLVVERWVAAGQLEHMEQRTARLLMCGILDNTLNFGAVITTDRDRQAYQQLSPLADLPDDWPAIYFTDCQQTMVQNIPAAIRDDLKRITYPLQTEEVHVGQMALWDASEVVARHLPAIRETLAVRPRWYMNLISLKDGCSYLLCDDKDTQAWLAHTLAVQFEGNLAVAGRMWLRKEIMKQAMDKENNT
ncbi:MAG TPA: DHH family phosphoesterase [Candidatus Saccharimonadales bacterium]|nr:DHH family phosphoesterase [Candidatus Saccharimonadales bacterium]